MLTAECDLCGQKGPLANFIFPRNNEPSFLRQMDYSMDKDVFVEMDDDTLLDSEKVFFYLAITTEHAGPDTTICKACFWKGLRKLMDTYGPATPDTASPSPDIDMRPVQSESEVPESGADEHPRECAGPGSTTGKHYICHRIAHRGEEIEHCAYCGLLRSNW